MSRRKQSRPVRLQDDEDENGVKITPPSVPEGTATTTTSETDKVQLGEEILLNGKILIRKFNAAKKGLSRLLRLGVFDYLI